MGEKILDTIAGNMNFFAFSKTSHIFDAIPGKFDYQYGVTLLTWLFPPIPRTMSMEKPPVFTGAVRGQKVFETMDPSGEGAAVPPGIVAEQFLNFGHLGVPVGMFILGYCLRLLYRSFRPLTRCNRSAVVLYVPFVSTCSFRLPSGSPSQCVVDASIDLIPIACGPAAVLGEIFLGLCFIGLLPRKAHGESRS